MEGIRVAFGADGPCQNNLFLGADRRSIITIYITINNITMNIIIIITITITIIIINIIIIIILAINITIVISIIIAIIITIKMNKVILYRK